MATDTKNIFDTLVEVFDAEDYAKLVKGADPRTRLSAYQDIIKLLTYRTKTTKADAGKGEMEKKIAQMFNIKSKED